MSDQGISIFLRVLYITSSVSIVAVNSLLAASFLGTKQSMKNASNILIVLLSIVDCLYGITVLPLMGILNPWPYFTSNESLNFARQALMQSFGGISMSLTILIGIDRYLHMNPDLNRPPSRLQKLFKKPWLYMLILCIVIFSVAVAVGEAYSQPKTNSITTLRVLMLSIYFICLLIMMSTLLVMYIRGYSRIRQFVAENPVYSNRGSTEEPEYVRELFKTVFLILIAMLVSYLPISILQITEAVFIYTNHHIPFLFSYNFFCFTMISLLFMNANSFTNALIILYRNKKSKKWLRSKVFGFCCKENTDAENQNNAVVIGNRQITSHM